ncbi:hypothetical protein OKW26_003653 [Paraburkholderia sp. 32]
MVRVLPAIHRRKRSADGIHHSNENRQVRLEQVELSVELPEGTVMAAEPAQPVGQLRTNSLHVGFASLKNVRITNVNVVDADPRFPMIIAGLVDHPVQNVKINNVSVQYRGGMKMLDAVENRQLSINHTFTAYQAAQTTEEGGGIECRSPLALALHVDCSLRRLTILQPFC